MRKQLIAIVTEYPVYLFNGYTESLSLNTYKNQSGYPLNK